MDWQALNILNHEIMAAEETVKRGQRKIKKVLVIDSVKFRSVYHIFNIRNFDYSAPIVLKQQAKAPHETVEISDVCQHVISMNDVRALSRPA